MKKYTKNNAPLVSVIIPCYNAEGFLQDTLNAVFAQSYQNVEIICVDDGSTDSTSGVLKRNKDKIKIISTNNKGASHARNIGLFASRGEYIQFLDADDLINPQKLEQQIHLIKQQGDSKKYVIFGNYLFLTLGEELVEKAVYGNDIWIGLIRGKIGITSSNLYQRELLMSVGGWNEQLKSSQDTELTFRLLQKPSSIICDRSYNTIVVQVESSISNATANKVSNLERSIKLRREIRDYLLTHNKLDDKRKKAVHQILFSNIKELGMYDIPKAKKYLQEYLPSNYFPDDKNISTAYSICYKLLGFSLTQKVLKLYQEVRK